MLTGFFKDLDIIVVLQTGCGSGFLPLGSGLESDSKKIQNFSLNTSGVQKTSVRTPLVKSRAEMITLPEWTPAGVFILGLEQVPELKF